MELRTQYQTCVFLSLYLATALAVLCNVRVSDATLTTLPAAAVTTAVTEDASHDWIADLEREEEVSIPSFGDELFAESIETRRKRIQKRQASQQRKVHKKHKAEFREKAKFYRSLTQWSLFLIVNLAVSVAALTTLWKTVKANTAVPTSEEAPQAESPPEAREEKPSEPSKQEPHTLMKTPASRLAHQVISNALVAWGAIMTLVTIYKLSMTVPAVQESVESVMSSLPLFTSADSQRPS
ncbi:putative transmembrane protein [Toxoplasma gondii RUB]|uniref:Transmembrane protein n=7 Tax=Toxoplasma gondii TaxID=5811 RepID=S7VWI2_TOXGG|nr:hypothetical protein TGGT1_305110 [Toxoplasma gondii GT1]KAF4644694.1 hypothetical protein TGRH88_016880 [Toxoplasma gondii]KFG33242.1 putative transmembrane protein [Toxoplasma gondii GAB2-2007-GAL-DOM2]KFG45461.1 putative transmembrane protein [Toxoplasma gondii FOU]KFG59228.1 putative transmembrane protein [Toxoplasma gondii RUB]KFH02549.1 putative transmembrane protein [Toxoplasma gondii VAND]RQX67860.1 putative transmembrane protein [Toxoplasma gondii CAST]